MKAFILNSCIAACKNKAGMEETTTNNREEIGMNGNTDDNNPNTMNRNSFEGRGTSEKRIHEFVDFSGGLLGI